VVKLTRNTGNETFLSQSTVQPDPKIFATKQFRDACVEAHNALFWTARGANSFLGALPQNQHLSLLWNGNSQDFRTRYFENQFQIGVNIRELEIYFCESGVKVPHSFYFDDRTPAFAEAWYLVELLHRDLDQSKFSTSLPFHSPLMLMGDTQDHNASFYELELAALNDCLMGGMKLLQQMPTLLAPIASILHQPVKIVLEPETFTLEYTVFFSEKTGQRIIVGFSIGDLLRPEPFYFIKDINQNFKPKSRSLDYRPDSIRPLIKLIENNTSDRDLLDDLCKLTFASVKTAQGL
jgi:hypothetical protein